MLMGNLWNRKKSIGFERSPPLDVPLFSWGGIPDERQGILYYKKGSQTYPNTPRSSKIPLNCRDEPYNKLTPVLPWTVKPVQRNGEHLRLYLSAAHISQKSRICLRSESSLRLQMADGLCLQISSLAGRLAACPCGSTSVTLPSRTSATAPSTATM